MAQTFILKQNRGIGDMVFALAFSQALQKKHTSATILWDFPKHYHEVLQYLGKTLLTETATLNKPTIIDLNKNISTRNFSLHEIERYLLAHPKLGLSLEDTVLVPLAHSPKPKSVTIALGARIPTRRWTTEGYCALIDYLLAEKYDVTLVGGDDVISEANILSRETSSQNLAGKLTLLETFKHLATTEFLIANDSGIAHLAALYDIPTLFLSFNKVQNNFRWHPWSEKIVVIRGKHNCNLVCHSSECQLSTCREALEFEDVKAGWELLLQARYTSSKAELTKTSLFLLFFERSPLYSSLYDAGYSVFLYEPSKNLVKTMIEYNINLMINPPSNIHFLGLNRLIASNSLSEYPLVHVSSKINYFEFLEELFSKKLMHSFS